ncbi:MAG: toxin component of a toxin/antitoxin system [Actinomycetia bacterium]|nr:toxin component of a toxin/antitoxin system [Actinomycetes bacterium]
MGVDRVTDPGDDNRHADDGGQEERLQQYAESVTSDAETKDPRTRQEHADDIPPPDEPPPSRSDSVDQRDSADQAKPTGQEEAPPPAEGDSSGTEDQPPHSDARVDAPEDSERREELSDQAGIKPDATAKYGNRPTEDPPDDQPGHQLTQESDEAPSEAPPDDLNMSIPATADGEAPKSDGGGPVDDQTRPLTDREWAEHITDVRDGLSKAYEQNLNTDRAYTINGAGEVWLEERDRLHDSIIEDLYAKAADVPCDFKAIVAGGLGGAGKTTVLTRHAGIDLSQYLMINPDGMKEEMARRGMIPEVEGLSPMEASELVHEESSYLASQLALRAQAEGKNLIWDITMSSEGSTLKRINELSSAGYTRIDGLFVEIPIETSLKRIESRHREGHDDYRAGKGLGGRYVPPEVTKNQEDPEWGSKNMRNFDAVKHRFNGWSIYNNSVDQGRPVLVDASRNRHVGY